MRASSSSSSPRADVGPFALTPDGAYAFVLLRDDRARPWPLAQRISLRSFVVNDIALVQPAAVRRGGARHAAGLRGPGAPRGAHHLHRLEHRRAAVGHRASSSTAGSCSDERDHRWARASAPRDAARPPPSPLRDEASGPLARRAPARDRGRGARSIVVPASARAVVSNLAQPTSSPRQVGVGTDPVLVQARNDAPPPATRRWCSPAAPGATSGWPPSPARSPPFPRGRGAAVRSGSAPSTRSRRPTTGATRWRTFARRRPRGGCCSTPTRWRSSTSTPRRRPRNPTPRTVRSFGGVPNGVVFSPGMNIGGRAADARGGAVATRTSPCSTSTTPRAARSPCASRCPRTPGRSARRRWSSIPTRPRSTSARRQSNDLYVLRLVTP
jgi:hypothetical protein